jgi:hypothetical protein
MAPSLPPGAMSLVARDPSSLSSLPQPGACRLARPAAAGSCGHGRVSWPAAWVGWPPWTWRFQVWAASWTASQGLPNGGVAQVQVAEALHGHAVEQGGGRDVDALGDLGAVVAQQPGAEQPPGGAVAGDPQVQAGAPG